MDFKIYLNFFRWSTRWCSLAIRAPCSRGSSTIRRYDYDSCFETFKSNMFHDDFFMCKNLDTCSLPVVIAKKKFFSYNLRIALTPHIAGEGRRGRHHHQDGRQHFRPHDRQLQPRRARGRDHLQGGERRGRSEIRVIISQDEKDNSLRNVMRNSNGTVSALLICLPNIACIDSKNLQMIFN